MGNLGPGKGKKKFVSQKRDSISPTYGNMSMFNKMRAMSKNSKVKPTTAQDTASYNRGFKSGLNVSKSTPFHTQSHMFKAGMFEGLSAAKKKSSKRR
jgi:hypothetical protein